MSTPTYGENDPLSTPHVDPLDTPTPIGDGLIGEAGMGEPSSAGTPPATASSGTSSSGQDSSGGGVDAAKEKASDALGSATEHGSDVVDTAKDEAVKVATEAKEKATDLLADLRSQVEEQSKTQLKGLSAKLGELADEIQSMVSSAEQNGTVKDVAQQLADKTHQLSSHLEGRQPADLLEDLRGFARRRPGTFLAGAGIAGVLAGRLTRGAKAAPDTTSSSDSSSGSSTGTGGSSPLASTGTVSDPPTFDVSPTPVGTPGEDVPLGQNTGGRQ
ncbi:hypothetical protein [Aeromicrobium wangtongii]|uniref:Uncharacterized protein n=1 Tax=Aeromicrobium wangtongii TaxID=2969247 RepID=A0ABY5MB00_9ACTN|nr:hypothetical protein [Aeromicrobium wangtongii]MCD9199779.1 hypothetical protein [Aeromicrobium wangtongii]UUP14129.1 hypothetical protein NQV15_02115 [Aeromicrobium wangtongii]